MIASFLHRLWESDEVIAVVIAALLSVISWIALRIFMPRGRLAWGVSHQHAFYLNNLQPPLLVYTKELWIQNVGRASVESIEVILAFAPAHFDIWPQRSFSNTQNPNGNLVVKVDNLNKREDFTISLFNISVDTPIVTNVRWNGGTGQLLPMAPQRVFPTWVRRIMISITLFGLFSLLYFLARAALALW